MIDLEKIKERTDLQLKELEGGLFGGNIRIVPLENKEMLFLAKDCALILEYKKTERAIKQHVLDDAKVKLKPANFLTP